MKHVIFQFSMGKLDQIELLTNPKVTLMEVINCENENNELCFLFEFNSLQCSILDATGKPRNP